MVLESGVTVGERGFGHGLLDSDSGSVSFMSHCTRAEGQLGQVCTPSTHIYESGTRHTLSVGDGEGVRGVGQCSGMFTIPLDRLDGVVKRSEVDSLCWRRG
ncbi:hypothetical protein BaRGS_00030682 [Batillaria attramentaria]|uniref:Uncharacterized protein n=1 Tax=Batillaria attramentaria TaxID=370345 RepID=A0ABD0JTI6_9CAEN